MKEKGPVLVLDAGNALFQTAAPAASPSPQKARAELVLAGMAASRTAAMAVGARDLGLGAAFLKTGATQVPMLSANLVDAGKKLLFPASKTVTVGGVKVGLVGISPMGNFPAAPGITGEPPVAAALKEAKKLRAQVDLVVVLAAVPYADALQLSNQAGASVDFIIQSHDARGPGSALRSEGAWVLPSGERGRQLGSLTLRLDGKGPFTDQAEAERAAQAVAHLDSQREEVKKRLALATAADVKKSLQATLEGFETRKKQLAAKAPVAAGGRSFRLEFVNMGANIKDDAGLKALVEKIEPPGSAAH